MTRLMRLGSYRFQVIVESADANVSGTIYPILKELVEGGYAEASVMGVERRKP